MTNKISGKEVFRLFGEEGTEHAEFDEVASAIRDKIFPVGTIIESNSKPSENWLELSGALLNRNDFPLLEKLYPKPGILAREININTENGFSTFFAADNYLLSIPFGEPSVNDSSQFYTKNLYKSIDNGETWTRIDNAFGGHAIIYWSQIVMDKVTGRLVIADRNSNKVFYSDTDGDSWNETTVPTSASFGNQIFWGEYFKFFMYQIDWDADTITVYTSENGAIWTNVPILSTLPSVRNINMNAYEVSIDYDGGSYVYLTIQSSEGNDDLMFYLDDISHPSIATGLQFITSKDTYFKSLKNTQYAIAAAYRKTSINIADYTLSRTFEINNGKIANLAVTPLDDLMIVLKHPYNGTLYAEVINDQLESCTVAIKNNIDLDSWTVWVSSNSAYAYLAIPDPSSKLLVISKDKNTFNIPFIVKSNDTKYWILAGNPSPTVV